MTASLARSKSPAETVELAEARHPVDVWVDPVCPFAWRTAQWLLAVEVIRPIQVRFHVMSLSVLNDGRDGISDFYRGLVDRAWGPVRVLIATEQAHGGDAVRDLYCRLASDIHDLGLTPGPEMYAAAIAGCGLGADLAAAATSTDFSEALRRSHHAGMDPVGYEVGTPVIHLDNSSGQRAAFFGPVLSSVPTADKVVHLWDALSLLAEVDEFTEFKRSRNSAR